MIIKFEPYRVPVVNHMLMVCDINLRRHSKGMTSVVNIFLMFIKGIGKHFIQVGFNLPLIFLCPRVRRCSLVLRRRSFFLCSPVVCAPRSRGVVDGLRSAGCKLHRAQPAEVYCTEPSFIPPPSLRQVNFIYALLLWFRLSKRKNINFIAPMLYSHSSHTLLDKKNLFCSPPPQTTFRIRYSLHHHINSMVIPLCSLLQIVRSFFTLHRNNSQHQSQ